jgi:hypothetical protein
LERSLEASCSEASGPSVTITDSCTTKEEREAVTHVFNRTRQSNY